MTLAADVARAMGWYEGGGYWVNAEGKQAGILAWNPAAEPYQAMQVLKWLVREAGSVELRDGDASFGIEFGDSPFGEVWEGDMLVLICKAAVYFADRRQLREYQRKYREGA